MNKAGAIAQAVQGLAPDQQAKLSQIMAQVGGFYPYVFSSLNKLNTPCSSVWPIKITAAVGPVKSLSCALQVQGSVGTALPQQAASSLFSAAVTNTAQQQPHQQASSNFGFQAQPNAYQHSPAGYGTQEGLQPAAAATGQANSGYQAQQHTAGYNQQQTPASGGFGGALAAAQVPQVCSRHDMVQAHHQIALG